MDKPKYKYYAVYGRENPRCIGVEEGERVYKEIAHGFMKGKSSMKHLWKIRSELTADQARKAIKMNEGNRTIRLRGTPIGEKLIEKGEVIG